ncbi:MAG: heat shock protein Hsp20 [Phenylobacterium sp.]|nr:heat shock protein Hsp20 [Phenylobacterium sp.]
MADPQTTPDSKGAPTKPREGLSPAALAGSRPSAEERSFAARDGAPPSATHEAVGAARDLSELAALATREAAERGRQAANEVATSWRGAFVPFFAMQLEMHRWFDDLWRQATGSGAFPALRPARPFGALGAAPMLGLPPTDVKETQEAYVLCAELPGLTRDDVDLQVRGDLLLVSGQKAEEKDDVSCAYRISERRFGRFDRSFPIPADVERNRIAAGFRDGVLTVTLPKNAAAVQDRTKIQINA